MDNLTPITREEILMNDEPLTPITREEKILAGEDLNPVTRREYFLKKYRHAGGDVMVEGLEVTANGTYTAPEDKAYSPVEVDVPLPENAYLLKTASGSLVSFSDGADLPMPSFICNIDAVQDLHGYDSPWVGGAGKNILPMTVDKIKEENTVGTWSGNAYIINGITYTILTDSDNNVIGINADGTASASAIINLNKAGDIIIPANTSFSLSGCPNGGGSSSYRLYPQNGDSSTYDEGSGKLVTLSSTFDSRFQIIIYSGKKVEDLVFYPMVKLANEIDMDFAPYSNICPISGHTGVDANVVGKNYMCKPVVGMNVNNLTGRIYGTPSSQALFATTPDLLPITFRNNETYTLSCDVAVKNMLLAYNENKEYMGRTAGNITNLRTIKATSFSTNTTGVGGKISYIVVRLYSDTDILQTDIDEAQIQLEKGETASTYEPYNPQSQTIQVSWQTEAGEVYGGEIDLVSGELTVTDGYIASYNGETLPSTWISDRDTYAEGTSPTTGAEVAYKMANPQTYQLDGNQIKSLLGNNNAWCDTGDIDIDYFAKEVTG